MATVNGLVTLDSIRLLDIDVNPNNGGGTAGNIGDIGIDDSGQMYINRDGTATNWRRVMQQSSGTGFTTGSIIFAGASGDLTESNSLLFWDNVNGRLGLGTTAPVSKFHQDNGALGAGNRFTNTATGATATDGCVIGIDASGNGIFYQFENLPILITTNNVLAATFTADQQAVFAKNIRLGSGTDTTDGNIRYDSTALDFFGRVGGVWKSLTGHSIDAVIQNNATVNSTTSTTFANLLTSTPAAGTYIVAWSADASTVNNADDSGEIQISVDGTEANNSTRRLAITTSGIGVDGSVRAGIVTYAIVTVNGSNVIQGRYRAVSGTFTLTSKALITLRIA